MTKSLTTTLLSAAFLTQSAFAGCGVDRCDNDYIDRLYVYKDGKVYVELDSSTQHLTCNLVGGTFIQMLPSNGAYDQMLAILMTAHFSDQKIGRVRMDDDFSDCTIAYVWQNRSNVNESAVNESAQ